MLCKRIFYTSLALLTITINTAAQQVVKDSASYKVVIAGPDYQRGNGWQWIWGRNCRQEWLTPVRVPVLMLDTARGGLTPLREGGGNETLSLRLQNADQKQYVIRSINKSRDEVVAPAWKNTFVENIIKDGVSMSHPYGALALPIMEQKAGIYHTNPKLVYVPKQAALDTFNNKYGNNLYLFEQRIDGDWKEARNLGNFKSFLSTEEVREKLLDGGRVQVDQYLFIKSRLFDMLVADWDRHDGNWEWGEMTINGVTWYVPIPHDRDQAFYTHNGKIIDKLLPAAGLSYMQNFDHQVRKITELNYEMRNLDRHFANAMTRSDWEYAAKTLRDALTDSVIEASVKQLPPEIYKVSGPGFISKLKSRREQLLESATKYYLFIAKEVEVIGTRQKDFFEVNSNPEGNMVVAVYHASEAGQRDTVPYYQRIFKPAETNEIRVFGIDGQDTYTVKNYSKDITLRLIGGPGHDSVNQTGRTVHIYDDNNNDFSTPTAFMHLSNSDTSIHRWDYNWFRYDKAGFGPSFYYDNPDRFYVGINYRVRRNKWRHERFQFEHVFSANYSILQNAPSVSWKSIYPNIIKKWDLTMGAGYDFIRWVNYYGTGNESQFTTKDRNYNRLRSNELFAYAGLQRRVGKHTFGFTINYNRVENKVDTERYVAKVVFPENKDVYDVNQYGNLLLRYSYVSVNDSIVPTRGVTFLAQGAMWRNFTTQQWFPKFDAKVQVYIPITKHISIFSRLGGITVANNEVLNSGQAYMHAIVGGSRTLRGFRRERLWGQTAAYNGNEIRYIWDLRTHIINGKIGVVGYMDQARVWMPGEKSNKIHRSYGPGILISAANKITGTITYGISDEIRLFQIRVERLL